MGQPHGEIVEGQVLGRGAGKWAARPVGSANPRPLAVFPFPQGPVSVSKGRQLA